MNLLPQSSGSRPRLACEIFAESVVAARSPEPGMPIASAAQTPLAEGAVLPSLKPGNIVDRVAVIAAVRRSMEKIGARSNARRTDLTLIIPDGAARVLLLDFDTLPSKLSEALPIVRFRLKRLLPFEADDAMVSFQVMSTSRSLMRVLAVAIPFDVLREYESVAREAGFEPGAVLPSSLAALASRTDGEEAAMVVNAHPQGITTAIERGGVLLLHRTIELTEPTAPVPANFSRALFEPGGLVEGAAFAAGRPFADTPDAAPVSQSPYAAPGLPAQFDANLHNALIAAPTLPGVSGRAFQSTGSSTISAEEDAPPVHFLPQDVMADEIARAVSVATAYYEDSLGALPSVLWSAGPLGATRLGSILADQGLLQENRLEVRELASGREIAGAETAGVPQGCLAGVAGALKS